MNPIVQLQMHQLMSITIQNNLEFEIRVKWKCEWGLVETLEMGRLKTIYVFTINTKVEYSNPKKWNQIKLSSTTKMVIFSTTATKFRMMPFKVSSNKLTIFPLCSPCELSLNVWVAIFLFGSTLEIENSNSSTIFWQTRQLNDFDPNISFSLILRFPENNTRVIKL